MGDVSENDSIGAPSASKRSQRIYVCWGLAFALLLATGVFCWLVVVPVWGTCQVVDAMHRDILSSASDDHRPRALTAVKDLGGPASALSKLRLYMKLPERLAPRKSIAVYLLGFCGEGSLPEVVRAVKGGYPASGFEGTQRKICAVIALGEIGPGAVEHTHLMVRHAIQEGTRDGKWYFPALLSVDPRGNRAVPELLGYLKSSNGDARQCAAWLLAMYGPNSRAAVPKLTELLADRKDVDNRCYYAMALAGVGREAAPAVAALIRALQDENWLVRRNALWALCRIGPDAKEGMATLIRMCQTQHPVGRSGNAEESYLAICALASMGDVAVPHVVAALSNSIADRDPLAEALIMIGPAAVPGIMKVVRDRDEFTQSNYAWALGEIGVASEPVVSWLSEALLKKSEMGNILSYEAAMALGKLGPAAVKAVPALKKAACGSDRALSELAIDVLGRIGPGARSALPSVEKLAESKEPRTERCAALAACRIGGHEQKALGLLLKALQSKEGDAAVWATQELGRMGRSAKEALPELRKRDGLPSAMAIWNIDGDASPAYSKLMAMADHSDEAVRWIAVRYIAKMGPGILAGDLAREEPPLGWALHRIEGCSYSTASDDARYWSARAYWRVRGGPTKGPLLLDR
jgi:HEAT repeat protein